MLFLISALFSLPLHAATVTLEPGADLPYRLQNAVIQARPGTVIELPAGRFEFPDELDIRVSHLTLRGRGMDRTILSFKNQVNGGQGILATGDAFTAEDFAIEDAPADAIKIAGANGVTLRRIRTEWTRGPNPYNGSYGIYPVQSRNILIEDCIARGASDTGIYVGQSRDIIVRRNHVYENVAGIELENSHFGDIYDNLATANAAGILVFDLPNLPIQGSQHIRVFHNRILDNNTRNFAPKGNIVAIVPPGTGFMVMASHDVEVFENDMSGNSMVNVAIVSFLMSELPITDPGYDPIPKRISIHDNRITPPKGIHLDLSSKVNVLVNLLFAIKGKHVSDIVYDGIGEHWPMNGEPLHGLPPEDRICIDGNVTPKRAATFANLQLDQKLWYLPFPGGPVLTDPRPFTCRHPGVAPVTLADPLPLPPPTIELPPAAVEALCNAPGDGPNWAALALVDCPKLSQYRLDPNDGGMPYDLTTPLFSDYAKKYRVVYVPPHARVKYSAEDAFTFPLGTVISKTFAFGDHQEPGRRPNDRNVETRLLIRRVGGWIGLPYLRDARGEDNLTLGGAAVELSFTHAGREIHTRYSVPNANMCASCHGSIALQPIGPKARLLNRDFEYEDGPENQLARWTRVGLLQGAPAPAEAPRLAAWNDPAESVDKRARAYLEVNCAHCHSPTGIARNTALFLDADETDPTAFGMCKPPVAAGIGAGNLKFDIVPGKPKQSILLYRLHSVEPAVKMPQVARSVVHEEGAALIEQWIRSLRGKCRKGP